MKVIAAALFAGVALANIFRYETAWKETYIADFENVDHVKSWNNWKNTFGKTYSGIDEESHRFLIWIENWSKINSFNKLGKNYTLGMNQFGDMTTEEFKYYIHGHGESCLTRLSSFEKEKKIYYDPSTHIKVDDDSSIDWSSTGNVTPVKNQGSCGSCWAFSTTGSMECQYSIATGKLNSLSEQELVDCSDAYGNSGCAGGWMDYAFQYAQANSGLCLESAYPYTGVDGNCYASSCQHYNPLTTYTDVTPDSDAALIAAVNQGCVSVAIEADQFAFQYYTGGVLEGGCGTSLDHGVLVVGYGALNGQEYYKIKNSWGTSWGINGYGLICRNCGQNGNYGECGILMDPSYPVVKA